MRCPACNNTLTAIQAESTEVDVCKDHCGGIWFDAGEFEHYDEASESATAAILKVVKNSNVAIDRSRPRNCPRCANMILKKRFFDSTHEIEIDQCESCAGIWLDPGELLTVRNANGGSVARKSVIDDFYAKATSGDANAGQQKGLKAVLGLLFR